MDTLRRLLSLEPPEPASCEETALRLSAADETRKRLATTEAGLAHDTASLLEAAIALHDTHSDEESCPVCETPAVITLAWRERAARRAAQLRDLGQLAETARDEAPRV